MGLSTRNLGIAIRGGIRGYLATKNGAQLVRPAGSSDEFY
jgi:hypothetical protein